MEGLTSVHSATAHPCRYAAEQAENGQRVDLAGEGDGGGFDEFSAEPAPLPLTHHQSVARP